MSSLSVKNRLSLCSFTFSDGRRCRTPRFAKHPRFCPYHAQKEARTRAADSLAKDLAYFFSGGYLSACDLSTALGRLLPAVIRGDVKPRTARTVAYLAQTLLQTIHVAEHEYTNTFGSNAWRNSVRNSVNGNYDYRFPPAPAAQPTVAPTQAPSNVEDGLQPGSLPPTPHVQPMPSPQTLLPPTSAEFVNHVVDGLETSQRQSLRPASQPAETPLACHSERSEEAASSISPLVTRHCHFPPAPLPLPTPSRSPFAVYSATTTAPALTANPFRINTCTPARIC